MPHDKNCRHLLDSLSEYIDGELGEELCQVLEKHLVDCENCKIVVDTLRKTIYLYQVSASDPEIPTDVRQRLYQRLDFSEFLE
jgi:anti-sigma factor (TIGR02949 family)